MKTVIKNTMVTTKPSNIQVHVLVTFCQYHSTDDQYVLMEVDNPREECRITFNPNYKIGYSPKYLGDKRLYKGGNDTLHGYTLAEVCQLADLMVDEFIENVHYQR